ncbi:MAG: sigma-70 family RNA polymerase sigma factor [Planctomycetota bacterium]
MDSIETTDERELVDRLRRREEAAFEHVIRSYGGRLRAVAFRLLRNDSDADDAVQEGFLSAYRAIESFEGRSLLSTWLHRLVINAALMRLRKRSRWQETSLEEELLPAFRGKGVHARHLSRWSETPDGAAERTELCTWVRETIDQLPESQRTLLILRDLEELSNQEIAELFDLTPNAAKIRVHRARQALRTLLEPRFVSER